MGRSYIAFLFSQTCPKFYAFVFLSFFRKKNFIWITSCKWGRNASRLFEFRRSDWDSRWRGYTTLRANKTRNITIYFFDSSSSIFQWKFMRWIRTLRGLSQTTPRTLTDSFSQQSPKFSLTRSKYHDTQFSFVLSISSLFTHPRFQPRLLTFCR